MAAVWPLGQDKGQASFQDAAVTVPFPLTWPPSQEEAQCMAMLPSGGLGELGTEGASKKREVSSTHCHSQDPFTP